MRPILRASFAASLAGAGAIILAACSASDVMRPTIDVQETAAVTVPSASMMPSRQAMPTPDLDQSDAFDDNDELLVGPMTPAPGLGEDYETPDATAPDSGYETDQPPQAIAPAPPPPAEPRAERRGLFGLFRPAPQARSGLPADEVECRRQLKRIGATFRDVPTIRKGQCGIDHPVELSALASGVQIKPAATLTCKMALTVAQWTKKELVPAARLRYFSGIKTIHQGSSYSCRKIAGSGTLSEHGKGNALDIMRIELKSGRDIGVKKKGLFAMRERGLLNNVRGDACKYFSTVLGPGYNYDYRDHFHFDIKPRRNGRVSCH